MPRKPAMPTEAQRDRLDELGYPSCFVKVDAADGIRYVAVAFPPLPDGLRASGSSPREAVQGLIHRIERFNARADIAAEATAMIRTVDPEEESKWVTPKVLPC